MYIIYVIPESNISITNSETQLGLVPHLCPMSEFLSLATLIKRLEAATTRLEDLALTGMSASTVTATNPTPAAPAASAQPKETQVELPRAVEAFSNALAGPVKQYADLSAAIGGPVQEQVRHLFRSLLTPLEYVFDCTYASSGPTFARAD
jgi:adenylyl cyclase-associated protein